MGGSSGCASECGALPGAAEESSEEEVLMGDSGIGHRLSSSDEYHGGLGGTFDSDSESQGSLPADDLAQLRADFFADVEMVCSAALRTNGSDDTAKAL